MTGMRGWGWTDQHLALDALVAFVDGELTPCAYDRAAAHLARCPSCAAEAAAQRNVRTAVRSAQTPSAPPSLLRTLQSIPNEAELPSQPDELALTQDGQLVTINRRDRSNRSTAFGSGPVLGSSTPLGASTPLGDSSNAIGAEPQQAKSAGRRTRQGASVVFSGLVLGALALINLPMDEPQVPATSGPRPQPRLTYTEGPVFDWHTPPPAPVAVHTPVSPTTPVVRSTAPPSP